MEQQKKISALSYAISAYFAHFELYIQMALVVLLFVVSVLLRYAYLAQAPRIDIAPLSFELWVLFIVRVCFTAWFWGGCVAVAIKIQRTERATFGDFMESIISLRNWWRYGLLLHFPLSLLVMDGEFFIQFWSFFRYFLRFHQCLLSLSP